MQGQVDSSALEDFERIINKGSVYTDIENNIIEITRKIYQSGQQAFETFITSTSQEWLSLYVDCQLIGGFLKLDPRVRISYNYRNREFRVRLNSRGSEETATGQSTESVAVASNSTNMVSSVANNTHANVNANNTNNNTGIAGGQQDNRINGRHTRGGNRGYRARGGVRSGESEQMRNAQQTYRGRRMHIRAPRAFRREDNSGIVMSESDYLNALASANEIRIAASTAATSAQSVTNATNVVNATNATNANSATNATNATNDTVTWASIAKKALEVPATGGVASSASASSTADMSAVSTNVTSASTQNPFETTDTKKVWADME